MNLEESPAVRRHLLPFLDSIKGAAELPPVLGAGYSMLWSEEQPPRSNIWNAVGALSAATAAAVAVVVALGFPPTTIRRVVVVALAGVAIGLSVVFGRLWLRRRQVAAAERARQRRRQAIVIRAAELVRDLLRPEMDTLRLSNLISALHPSEQPKYQDRWNIALDGATAASTLVLARGVSFEQHRLLEEASAFRDCVSRLHELVCQMVASMRTVPRSEESKDKAWPIYKAYSAFVDAYRANEHDSDIWQPGGRPLAIERGDGDLLPRFP